MRKGHRPGRTFGWLMAGIVAVPAILGWRSWRQSELDYALSEAVSRRDARAVCRLLRQGASPHAPWSGYRLRDRIDRMLRPESWKNAEPSILQRVRGDDAAMTRLLETAVSDLPGDAVLAAEERRARANEALFQAAERGDTAAVGALLDGGLSVNARDRDGRTPLIYAVNARQAATVACLLRRGADVNARTGDGLSVLANALIYGDARLCTPLLQAGAQVNVQDQRGDTPLIEAVRRHDLARVTELLRHGADPNLRPANGPGPLDWARFARDGRMAAVLRRAGARAFRSPMLRY